jgi:hypothetical protein
MKLTNMKIILLSIFSSLIMMSCSESKHHNHFINQTQLQATTITKVDSSIVPEGIYLYMDSVKIGRSFTNKSNKYGYYRLLFTSSEEMQTIYVEKLNIVGDGLVKLGERFDLSLKLFNGYVKSIHWVTPEIININLNDTIIHFNLSTKKVIK